MLVLDTRDVCGVERFSYWVDSISAQYFPIDLEVTEAERGSFSARMEGSAFGDMMAVRHITSPHCLKRSKQAISKRETGMLMLGFNIGKAPIRHAFGDAGVVTNIGEGLLYDMDREHHTLGQTDNDALGVLTPRERLAPYLDWRPHGGEALFAPRVFRRGRGLSPMVSAVVGSFFDATQKSDAERNAMNQVLVHMLALTLGFPLEEDKEAIGRSLADARFRQAINFIENNVHDPRLSAGLVARYLGISVRRLYAIFEPTGLSIAKRISSARMERAKQLLMTRRGATILEIALACGFYSTSTFYRVFSELHGMSPNRFREQYGEF